MTQELQIVNSLIETSEYLRQLFPDTYDEQSREVQGCIREVMEARNLDVLPATLKLMEVAREKGRENHIHWFAAAACDMLCGKQSHESLRTKFQKLADSFKL